jgi:DtxR family Mn-dependent transcriptional regulator
MSDHKIDELLELIWTQREDGKDSLSEILRVTEEEEAEEAVKGMAGDGLVTMTGDRIALTDKGRERAKELIRRHRLAERLFTEAFQMKLDEDVESNACEFEHVLSPEVTESVCTFLGHPPTCPHGRPIPRGKCCEKFHKEMKPLVMPLNELHPGEEGRIVFIAPKNHTRLDRLSTMGIIPGSIVRLHQKRPSYVLEIGETTLAVDGEIVREIYVKKV